MRQTQKLSTQKKKLWKLVSQYTRERDSFVCFTCGKKGEGSGLHAGHFLNKSLGLALYFEENNIHAQCYNCNINLGGNGAEYYRRMVLAYGQSEVDRIFTLKTKVVKLDYELLTQQYKKKWQSLGKSLAELKP